jgi:hypothetical protein
LVNNQPEPRKVIMKTRTLIRLSVGIVASGLFVAAALAGPGPQYWAKSPAKPAEKPAPPKMDEHPTGKCDGCKTTPIWVVSDRGPAGKGVPGARVTGYAHSCSGCGGKIAMENGKTKAEMKHSAGCTALVCCK